MRTKSELKEIAEYAKKFGWAKTCADKKCSNSTIKKAVAMFDNNVVDNDSDATTNTTTAATTTAAIINTTTAATTTSATTTAATTVNYIDGKNREWVESEKSICLRIIERMKDVCERNMRINIIKNQISPGLDLIESIILKI